MATVELKRVNVRVVERDIQQCKPHDQADNEPEKRKHVEDQRCWATPVSFQLIGPIVECSVRDDSICEVLNKSLLLLLVEALDVFALKVGRRCGHALHYI